MTFTSSSSTAELVLKVDSNVYWAMLDPYDRLEDKC